MTKTIALLALLAIPVHARCDELGEGYIMPPAHQLTTAPRLSSEMPLRFGTSKKLVAAAIAAQLLDAISTDYILSTDPKTGKPRGMEANALMKNVWVRWITKSIFIAGSIGMAEGQQAKVPMLKRVPQWKAESFVKTTFWTGFVPGAANTLQGFLK